MRDINPSRYAALAALAKDPLTIGTPAENQPDLVDRFRNWRWFIDTDGIAWALLNKAGSSVNTLSTEVLAELDQLIGLTEAARPKALALRSIKPSGFIAGAEISEFADMRDEQIVEERITQGLGVLDRLERLPMPSASAADLSWRLPAPTASSPAKRGSAFPRSCSGSIPALAAPGEPCALPSRSVA